MLAQYEQNETGAELVRALDEVIASELDRDVASAPVTHGAAGTESGDVPTSRQPVQRDPGETGCRVARDASAERSRIHPT